MPQVSRYVYTLNKAQQRALKAVYDRCPLYATKDTGHEVRPMPMTYRQFRKTARVNTLLDCVMVPWAGMWLGIEKDGYTHS